MTGRTLLDRLLNLFAFLRVLFLIYKRIYSCTRVAFDCSCYTLELMSINLLGCKFLLAQFTVYYLKLATLNMPLEILSFELLQTMGTLSRLVVLLYMGFESWFGDRLITLWASDCTSKTLELMEHLFGLLNRLVTFKPTNSDKQNINHSFYNKFLKKLFETFGLIGQFF